VSKRKWLYTLLLVVCGVGFLGARTANQYIWQYETKFVWRDDGALIFGTGEDVTIVWDADSLDVEAAANNSVMNIGDGTESFDVHIFGSAVGNQLLWDASGNELIFYGSSTMSGIDDIATTNMTVTELNATDVLVDDDLLTTDDLVVGGDAIITGSITDVTAIYADGAIGSSSTITAATTLQGATVIATSKLYSQGDADIADNITGCDDIACTNVTAGTTVQGATVLATGSVYSQDNVDIADDITGCDTANSTAVVTGSVTSSGNVTITGDVVMEGANADLTQVDTVVSTNATVANFTTGFNVLAGGDITFEGDTAQILQLDTLNTTNVITAGITSTGNIDLTGDANITGDIVMEGATADLTQCDTAYSTDVQTVTITTSGDATVDDLVVASSTTMQIGYAGFLMDIATPAWDMAYGSCSPTTGATRFTTATIPLPQGSIVDSVGVRYCCTDAIAGDNIVLSVLKTDGDGSVTHLATVGASSASWETTSTAQFNYTAADNEALLVTIQAIDDSVQFQSIEVVFDQYELGNP